MAQKPSIPKGTRDFSPVEMVRRNYIFDTIKSVFKLYGYLPIETPAMENLTTLLGKYGDEGDKLLFKTLNSGDFLKKVPVDKLESPEANEIVRYITEKGLRYDLTVPFARYVVQHRNDITFPFKRFQIQPVWRADRPQKGRYREFFQCDVDVIGSRSLLNEVELVQIINDIFIKLNIGTTISLNNRKILYGITEYIGETEKFTAITVAIDKLDKIGIEKVKEELRLSDISDKGIEQIGDILTFEGTTDQKLAFLEKLLESTETGKKGIEEMTTVFDYLKNIRLVSKVELDLTLARGLNYYTGAIIEVKANDVQMGSICGGGRYDDLTGIFGLPDVSGVGVSFGADRIYDVMLEKNLFPKDTSATTHVLFINFGKEEEKYCLPYVAKLRENGINTEMFPDAAKLKKQMNYANNKNIPFVVLAGEQEVNSNTFTLKNMKTGEQKSVDFEELLLVVK
jgi:histidyl-tRNA synthetase